MVKAHIRAVALVSGWAETNSLEQVFPRFADYNGERCHDEARIVHDGPPPTPEKDTIKDGHMLTNVSLR